MRTKKALLLRVLDISDVKQKTYLFSVRFMVFCFTSSVTGTRSKCPKKSLKPTFLSYENQNQLVSSSPRVPFINVCNYLVPKRRIGCQYRSRAVARGFAESGPAVQGVTAARRSRPDFQQIFCTVVMGQSILPILPGICGEIVILSVLAVDDLSENLGPGVGHLSILLEAAFPK